jgi:3-dehydroquinate dehydratase-2
MRVLIINGPNLNLLGAREPETYGSETLDDLERTWRRHATRIGIGIATFQSNHEGAIIDAIQGAESRFDGIVINPGALSHYSYAIYDALVAVGIPTVEIHISNIYERESWRHKSVTAQAAIGVIYGRGTIGYVHAMDLIATHLMVPPTTVRYGTSDEQVLDLRTPDRPSAPVAIIVHGGFWRDIWKRDVMAPMAVALTRSGWATANIEYTRGTGSFPEACSDVAAAIAWIDANAERHDLAHEATVVIGHSAGGYLALRSAHTIEGLRGVVALAPVTDLEALSRRRPDDDPVSAFLGASLPADTRLLLDASLTGEPKTVIHLIHGTRDDDVPASQSATYADRFPERVVAHMLEGVGHMDLIDPCDPAFATLTDVLEDLRNR